MNNYDEDKFNEDLRKEARNINIEVPDKLKNNIYKTLDELPERNVKRKSKFKKALGLVAGAIVCMFAFNIVMPAYAETLPLIGPTFKSINEAIGVGKQYVEGAKDINISKKYEDTTMTIKNIYYDGIELAIAYELKSENGFDDKPIIFPIIKSGFKNIEYDNEENDGDFINDNTYVGLASYTFTENELSDKSKIEFTVNDLYGNWVGHYPKKYKFKLSLDAENMGKETHNINKEINYEDRVYKIKEVITSKLNTFIYVDILKKINNDINSEKSTENYGLRSDDNKLRFFIIDDKGMPIDNRGMSLSSSFNINKDLLGNGTFRFSNASDNAKSITIIPYISEDYKKWGTEKGELNKDSNTLKGELNKDSKTLIKIQTGGEYIVNGIDFKEDKTLMDIKVKGYLERIDNIGIGFWKDGRDDEDRSNWVINDKWYEEKTPIDIQDIKFNGINDGYNFTLTLPPLDSDKEYYFSADNSKKIILENEKITIDLSK